MEKTGMVVSWVVTGINPLQKPVDAVLLFSIGWQGLLKVLWATE
jgi:hypothetical protein